MVTRYSQPQSGARIDWGNPLTSDILAAWNFASDYEPVTGTLATRGASNVSNVVSQYGKGIKVSGTSNLGRYVLNAPRSAVDIGAGDFTVFVSFVLDAAGGYCAIGRWNTGGTPATSDWMLGGASSGLGTDIGFTVAVGSSTYAASFVSGMPTSGLNTLVGRRVGTTIYVDRFLNGVFIQRASTTNAGITTVNYNAARSTKIGEIDVGAGYNVRMTAYNAATFRRFISDAELKTLVQNQWQIFQPTSRAIWVPVGGGNPVVTSDTVADYLIREAVTSDASAAYAIRTSATSDTSASYAIAATITSDTSASYAIRTSANADTSASYSIAAPVSSDTSASYSILTAGAVTSDTASTYAIRGVVQSDASVAYELRGAVQSTLSGGYDIRQAVASDTSASYAVTSLAVVTSDLVAAYTVTGTAGLSEADIAAIWAYGVRTITGPTAADIAAAILAQAQLTPIYADARKMNGAAMLGDGTAGNLWRGE